jgi:hypothetical protein
MTRSSRYLLLGVLGSVCPILAAMPSACARGKGTPLTASYQDDEGGPGLGDDGGMTPIGFLRFADWSPDAIDGFDICIAPHSSANTGNIGNTVNTSDIGDGGDEGGGGGVVPVGSSGNWVGPLIGGKLAFPNVSAYIPVPVGAYDLAVMVPGKSCASVVPVLALPPLAAGGRLTVAMVGDLQVLGTDQKAQLVAFADDATGPQTQAAVRFINAQPSGSVVVFGTGTLGAGSFTAITGNVPFGSDSWAPANGVADVDQNGYALLSPASRATVSVHDAATGTIPGWPVDAGFGPGAVGGGVGGGGGAFGVDDLATWSNAAWQPGSVGTVALVDGDIGFKPELLVCNDLAPPVASSSLNLSPCAVVTQ